MNGGVKVNKTDFEITITEKHKLNLFLHHFISAQLYMHSVLSNSANFLGHLLSINKKIINRASEQNNLIITRLLLNHCEVQAEYNSI